MEVTHWHWLALGITLIVLEMLTGGGFLLWIGLSACAVFVISFIWSSLTFPVELTLFSFGSVTVSVLWWFYIKRHPIESDTPDLNQRAAQYMGRILTLEEAIVNGRGRVQVGDTFWRVQGEDMPQGTKVKVVSQEGVILIVEKAE